MCSRGDKDYELCWMIRCGKGDNGVKVKVCDCGEGGENKMVLDWKDGNRKLEGGEGKCIYG